MKMKILNKRSWIAEEIENINKNALIASEEGYKDAQNLWDEISKNYLVH